MQRSLDVTHKDDVDEKNKIAVLRGYYITVAAICLALTIITAVFGGVSVNIYIPAISNNPVYDPTTKAYSLGPVSMSEYKAAARVCVGFFLQFVELAWVAWVLTYWFISPNASPEISGFIYFNPIRFAEASIKRKVNYPVKWFSAVIVAWNHSLIIERAGLSASETAMHTISVFAAMIFIFVLSDYVNDSKHQSVEDSKTKHYVWMLPGVMILFTSLFIIYRYNLRYTALPSYVEGVMVMLIIFEACLIITQILNYWSRGNGLDNMDIECIFNTLVTAMTLTIGIPLVFGDYVLS
jgi:hypothetical protein